MEVRRAADVLLRSRASPLCSLLNPAFTSQWTTGGQFCYRAANNNVSQRTLTTSARTQAKKLSSATTSSAPVHTRDAEASSKPADDITEQSKSLWASRPSRASPTLDAEREKRMNGGNSAEDILDAMNNLSRGPGMRSSTFDSSLMLDPSGMSGNRKALDDVATGMLTMPQKARVPMRLTPSTGRSISIGTGIDVARGLRLLEQSCARNRVRADFTYQRFHERGGLKRKRLRRQRWRKKFMEGFKATVERVKQLKHQGW